MMLGLTYQLSPLPDDVEEMRMVSLHYRKPGNLL